jgi:hypothetical protein
LREELVVDESSGIGVRYIHDPKADNSAHTLTRLPPQPPSAH